MDSDLEKYESVIKKKYHSNIHSDSVSMIVNHSQRH